MNALRWTTAVILIVVSLLAASGAPAAAGGAGAAGLWVTPLELDFGPVGAGSTSPEQIVTITNTSSTILSNFAGGAVASPFMVAQDCAGAPIPPGGSCHYYFRFSPTAAGSFSATSNSSTSLGGLGVASPGRGGGPGLWYDFSSLDFGYVLIDQAATQRVTVHNTGLAPLTGFTGGAWSAPFVATSVCLGPIAPGGFCYIDFTFSPTSSGPFSQSSSITTNAGTIEVSVQGIGRTGGVLSGHQVTPRGLDFGPVGTGKTSQAMSLRVTNPTGVSLGGINLSGVAAPFAIASNGCSGPLPGGAACNILLTFSPVVPGAATTTATLTDAAGSATISLRGTGVAAGLWVTPLAIDFGPRIVGSDAPMQIVTIHNTGFAVLAGFAGGAIYSPFNASQNCAGGVAPGASCQYFIDFRPEAVGVFSATSSTSTNAGTFDIVVHGEGLPFTVYLPFVRR